MKFYALFLWTVSFSIAANFDTGTGALGNCTQATFDINTRTYNCTSLTISANNNIFSALTTAGNPVVIKVQGNVTISAGATLSLNGENASHPSTTGGRAGAGGNAGGNSASDAEGSDGFGSGGGKKGLYAPFISYNIGGGGGGASYNSTSLGQDGVDGENVNGSVANTLGNRGASYGDENQFATQFLGGSGGGAGAGGDVSGAQVGGAGGGGGGAIHIMAGGDITIDGKIEVNGGDGTVDAGNTSGGGGGSGGAIWLQARGDILGTGSVESLGGDGGKVGGAAASGDGGNGGPGRIRFDDQDGIVTLSSTGPTAVVKTLSITISNTSNQNSRTYQSSITCSNIFDLDEQKNLLNYLISLISGFILLISINQKRKQI